MGPIKISHSLLHRWTCVLCQHLISICNQLHSLLIHATRSTFESNVSGFSGTTLPVLKKQTFSGFSTGEHHAVVILHPLTARAEDKHRLAVLIVSFLPDIGSIVLTRVLGPARCRSKGA